MSDTISPTNICRICLEEESNYDLLINPCRCNGTSKYVHKNCINTWFDETTNPEAKKMCMECKTLYIFKSYHIPEKYKLLFQDENILKLYCKIVSCILPISSICFLYDSITKNYYLIHYIFPKETKDIFITIIDENSIFGINYYYYFYNYLFVYLYFLYYVYVVIFKIKRTCLYLNKASFSFMVIIVYLFLFFWINGILGLIMDMETIVLFNIICNIFSPQFIYRIVKHHKFILTNINNNNSKLLLPYTNDEEESDTDSETFLLHVEIE